MNIIHHMVVRRGRWAIVLPLALLFASTAGNAVGPKPPVAAKIAKADTLHGDVRVDNYYWLRQRGSEDVLKYLTAENAYTADMMKPTAALQESLYQEMVGRIKETDENVPYREGPYFYYSRTEKGKQYPIYCRKKGSLDAPEEILLDQNELAKGYTFLSLGGYDVSPDGSMLAYALDTNGSERQTLFIKNLMTGAILPERMSHTASISWAPDNRTLFYTTKDDAERSYRLYRHQAGAGVSVTDPLVYEETDGQFELDASRSKSGRYIFVTSSGHSTSDVRYIPADRLEATPSVIVPRAAGVEYSVEHHGDDFYILTNQDARNFRLVKTPVSDTRPERWTDVVPHREDVTLEGIEVFQHHLVVLERAKGLQNLRVMDLRDGASHSINFPEPVYSAFNSTNRVFETNVFRFSYASFITPSSVYDYNMDTKERTLLKQQPVLGGYDPTLYRSERILAKAPDGVEVPISIVYRNGVKLDGSAPLHLTGYGAYGASSNVGFSSNRLSLINRGVIFAIAHVRGGGDLGRSWKEDGKKLHKKNTFTDFIASAEHLIAQRYTSKDRLTIEGGSAGGLLIGAVTVMRPDLFKAVVAQVPFVDVLNTMLDPTLMYTTQEYEEWGNPNIKEYYDYMKSYCPYTNVRKQAYPNMLVKVGYNDPRVNYWEGTKFVAKIRDLSTDTNTVLLKVNMGAGHGGSSGRYERLREIAFDYAYLLTQYGATIAADERQWRK
jgi:oligopeptidase B